MDNDLIERTRLAAQILRDVGGQSALAATVDEAADALEAARADSCVALVADIRWACGDKGKRMQDELVEYVRELARDAGRYRWLREYDVDSYLACGRLEKLDAAIDAAMAAEGRE